MKKDKSRIRVVLVLFVGLVVLLCLIYLREERYDQPKGPNIRHDNVDLQDFLILESLMGDGYELFMENALHSNLGFAMQYANRSFYYERPGLGFREGVVHYQDSNQAYQAFQGYLHEHGELDTNQPSLIHPEFGKDKTIHWYAGVIPPDEAGIALNLFFAQCDDVIVFYEIALPVSLLDETGFIEFVEKLDANAVETMERAVVVDPLLPTFTPLPSMK